MSAQRSSPVSLLLRSDVFSFDFFVPTSEKNAVTSDPLKNLLFLPKVTSTNEVGKMNSTKVPKVIRFFYTQSVGTENYKVFLLNNLNIFSTSSYPSPLKSRYNLPINKLKFIKILLIVMLNLKKSPKWILGSIYLNELGTKQDFVLSKIVYLNYLFNIYSFIVKDLVRRIENNYFLKNSLDPLEILKKEQKKTLTDFRKPKSPFLKPQGKLSKSWVKYFLFFKKKKKHLVDNLYHKFITDFLKIQTKELFCIVLYFSFFSYRFLNTTSSPGLLVNSSNRMLFWSETPPRLLFEMERTGSYPIKNRLNNQPYLSSKKIVNTIYCLSHRELWEQEKDWQDFAYYYYSNTNITDLTIPFYKDRNFDLLFNFERTNISLNTNNHQDKGLNINTSFSGAGLVQKLLNDMGSISELKKIYKQNRILLFEYNKHLKKLKQNLNMPKIGKIPYHKACQIRDLLIRRTKLTRKIQRSINDQKLFREDPKYATEDQRLFTKEPKNSLSELNNKQETSVTVNSSLSEDTQLNSLNSFAGNMILTLLPVLPPVLRPVLKMSGQFTISDLNRLYQRIIYRNERLKKFLKDPALSSSFEMKYAQRLLQEAVDNLIQNGKSGVVPEKDQRGRLLKSLSDILKGKQGRFRQYLLGKRVDYSGRSVIVVGPSLKLHECGIPKEMALVLYSPFLIKRILNEKLADTYLSAKKLLKIKPLLVSQLLREIMKSCPVLLNRAPTLHRLGFQAFQPKLVDGKAILLHPLVCPAFNADFDGDQMAVHIPITFEARAEAWKLMLARNNLLSPATGEPLILPSQDMVLGCYYLTTNCAEKWSKAKKGSGMYFSNVSDVLKAYNHQLLHLHAVIWVNIKGQVSNLNIIEQPLEVRIPLSKVKRVNNTKDLEHEKEPQVTPLLNTIRAGWISVGNYIEIFKTIHNILQIKNPNHISYQIIKTTPGKIIFNLSIKNSMEKRPRLCWQFAPNTGSLRKKLTNTIDLHINPDLRRGSF
jgi:DNA-directed RNA polymerase subunit beta'